MDERPCRILFFAQNDWFFHLHFFPLGKALAAQGAEVSVACLVQNHGAELEQAGIRVIPLKTLDVRSLGLFAQLRTIVELWRLFRRERPDVLQLISPKPVLLGSIAARLAGIRVVLSMMTGLGFLFSNETNRFHLLRRLVLGLLRWAHGGAGRRVLFQNMTDRQMMLKSGVITAGKAVLVAGVGTDLKRFKPGSHRNKVPVIVLGARMIRDKGVVDLVEAARMLQRQGFVFRVLLCGAPDPGNPNTLTETDLRRWHQEGVVEWLGHVEDFERVLKSADIACLPTYYREGLPKFLLDSAAAGLALVSADAPGCRDVVRDGVNGYIVPRHNPPALAEALGQLIGDPALRRRMGAASRRIAEQEFSHDAFVERVFAVYRDLASETNQPECSFSLT